MLAYRITVSAIALASGFAITGPVLAQDDLSDTQSNAPPNSPETSEPQDSPSQLDEIVVTAQRRAENLQSTPLAISAVSGETLQQRQVTNVLALDKLVPNLTIGTTLGNARISIRGISFDSINTGAEARVAYHLDGVYISRPPAQLAAFFDVDRIEVLRGPQGTLYGRNATAGAVNVITGAPEDTLGGSLRLTAGTYDLFRAEGAFTMPLSDTVSIRIAGQSTDRGGYGESIGTGAPVDDEHNRAIRGKLRADLSPNLQLNLSADYFSQNDNSGSYHYLGQGSRNVAPSGVVVGGSRFASNPYDTGTEFLGNRRRIWGTTASFEWDLGPTSLTSISGYRFSNTRLRSDLDSVPARLTEGTFSERSEQFSQELRAQGEHPLGTWLVGAYYFFEDVSGSNAIPYDRIILAPFRDNPLFIQGFFAGGEVETEAFAAFGQTDFEIFDGLKVILGGRYSTETKALEELFQNDTTRPFSPTNPIIPRVVPPGTQSLDRRWSSFTPQIGLEWQASDDLFLYATYSEGFKSGGYNVGGIQPPFNPEEIKSYEGGARADWFDRRLRTNISVFYYDYKDIQVTRALGLLISQENAAAARIYGIEAEITALLTDGLTANLNASSLNAEFTEYSTRDQSRPELGVIDLSGNRLPQAPDYTISAGLGYEFRAGPGEVTARVDATFVDKVFYSAFNREDVAQAAHSRVDLLLRYALDQGVTIEGWVKNLTDETNLSYAVVGSGLTGFPILGSYQPPRTVGLTLGYTF